MDARGILRGGRPGLHAGGLRHATADALGLLGRTFPQAGQSWHIAAVSPGDPVGAKTRGMAGGAGGLATAGIALCHQGTALDRSKLLRWLGSLPAGHGRAIGDGEIQTACQESCPAGAITFGNLIDLKSRVAQLKHDERNYVLLEELNLRPPLSYMAKVRNVEGLG